MKKLTSLYIFVIITFYSGSLAAQVKAAAIALDKGEFTLAAEILEDAIAKSSSNNNVKYYLGITYTELDRSDEVVAYFESVDEDKVRYNKAEYYYWKGNAYFFNYQFDKAVVAFEKQLESNKRLEVESKNLLKFARNAKELLRSKKDYYIENLGAQINSSNP